MRNVRVRSADDMKRAGKVSAGSSICSVLPRGLSYSTILLPTTRSTAPYSLPPAVSH